MPRARVPADVAAIRKAIAGFLNTTDDTGRKVGGSKCGVYAFYDYDREPIYVGQSTESLRGRIGRHLTNRRTDAVAMNVLDPFEVASIEVWPFFDLVFGKKYSKEENAKTTAILAAAEFTVYQQVLKASKIGAVLNEKSIPAAKVIALPKSYFGGIIPKEIFEQRIHPDVRIARRSSTIAALARVISERQVSAGLRQTLLTQAKRLEMLAQRRFEEAGGVNAVPVEGDKETEDSED